MRHKEKTDVENKFPYLKDLQDNEPKGFPAYEADASILHEQIDHKHIGNVAVVAQYGAGKSSVINKYLQDYRDNYAIYNNLEKPQKNHYVRVSLATFNKDRYDEVGIERSILQQLLYSSHKDKLPKSKIERTNKTPYWKVLIEVLGFVLVFGSLLMFGLDVGNIYSWNIAGFSMRIICGIIGIIGGISALAYILYYRRLKHIKYKDLEADFTEDSADKPAQVTHLINKFIDEVLYFFECTKIDLVIFEDLDRLDESMIFPKLRELNTIINNSSQCKKKVTFLYAVKDDLFGTAEERAKFFDFILPVVPVINPVTTQNTINNIFDKIETEEVKVSREFVQDISIYVPNMRVLNNTVNDYLIMYAKIFRDKNVSIFLKKEKLFALCLYKNLYPYDYALLEQNKGLIPLFIDMHSLREQVINDINKQINENDNNIEFIISKAQKEFEKLKNQLEQHFRGENYNSRFPSISSTKYIKGITTFEGLHKSDIRHPNHGYYTLQYYDNDNDLIATDNESYYSKELKIKDETANEIKKLRERNSELTRQRYSVYSMAFVDLIKFNIVAQAFNEDGILKQYQEWLATHITNKKEESTDVNNEQQYKEQVQYFVYMVLNGYIDEHYIEYTSNYKSDSFAPADVTLVKSIKNNIVDYNASIENVGRVIERLNVDDFKKQSILNRQIVDNIFKFTSRNNEKQTNLIDLLTNMHDEKVVSFFDDYIKKVDMQHLYLLIDLLLKKDKTVCANLLKTKASQSLKDTFVTGAIAEGSNYEEMNGDNIITNYLNQNENYWNIFSNVNDCNKVKDAISKWNLVINDISCENNMQDIYDYIVDNNHYVICTKNIVKILGVTERGDAFYSAPYTYVVEHATKNVIDYIENNINIYVKDIMLADSITLVSEKPDNIFNLIHNDNLSEYMKGEIIKKYNKPFIKDITKEPVDQYVMLFETNAVEPTWNNIQHANIQKGFDCVKSYLEKHADIKGEYYVKEKSENATRLFYDIVDNMMLSDIDYYTSKMGYCWAGIGNVDIGKFTDEKLSICIKNGLFKFYADDYPYLWNKPISLNQYLSKYDKEILKSDSFFNRIANQFVYCDRYDASYIDRNYPEYENMIANVIGCRDASIQMKKEIVEKYGSTIYINGYEDIYANYIIDNNQPVPENILWQFAMANIDVDKKKKILIICKDNISDINTNEEQYILSFDDDWAKLYKDSNMTYINAVGIDLELVNMLKYKKHITARKSSKANSLMPNLYKIRLVKEG